MDTITLYQWGADGVLAGSTQADPMVGVPERSTPTAPPKAEAPKVVVWNGSGWAVLDAAPAPDLEPARAAALARLSADYEAALAGLTATYPPAELLTWTTQEREAKAWTADNATKTVFLSALYEARKSGGIVETFGELVGKVLAKGDAYAAASGIYTGQRHAAEAAIATSTDPASVAWAFSLS